MKAPPQSTKSSLNYRLIDHARTAWPELAGVEVRFRANFAYVDGRYGDGTVFKLCRLRYGGSTHTWGFAIDRGTRNYGLASERTARAQRREEAVDDLREALAGLIAEFGVPDELTVTVDVA